jgi:2-polyprenyl-3-methyl-5-hydroxy-6-metoxy-1,4-benzoquinol methylase
MAVHMNSWFSDLRERSRKLYWVSRLSILKSSQPHRVLHGIDHDLWFWLNTAGYRRFAIIRSFLPGLPDIQTQTDYVGVSGDAALKQGFAGYRLFSTKMAAYGHPLSPESHVLDFGCGWGRITRFFLRDVAPSNIVGADCSPTIINCCRQYNRWCKFLVSPILPPVDLAARQFDLIYLYSVFSHLSERAADGWVTEFCRLLKPRGLLIATTRPRVFIQECEKARKSGLGYEAMARAFAPTSEWLKRYDQGEFCFEGTGGGENRTGDFYGETCIPRRYVETHWNDRFHIREFLSYVDVGLDQNVIVAQKE